jgi:hypothetical protein
LTRAKAFFCLKKSWIPGQARDDERIGWYS